MHHGMLIAFLLGSLMQSDIASERVFGPEAPGRYKHPASITELDNGDLLLVYYGGSGEYADDSTVYSARLRKGETKWSSPRPVTPRPQFPEGNPVVWQAPDGIVWLFSVVRSGATWSTSRIMSRISTDGAETWQEPIPLTTEAGTMVRSKPIVLPCGDYLLPIYHETGNDREAVGPDTTSLFLRYDLKSKRWSESSRIRSRLGNLQPAVAALDGDHLVCYCRRGGDYRPRNDGYIVRSESRDGGRTWSPGKDSPFPNPNAAIDLLRLANGHLLLIYNDSMNSRTPLTVALSTDNDRSYPYRRNIAEGPGDFAYPYAIQTRDGKIHLIYTSNRRTVINRAVFDEAAIVHATRGGQRNGNPADRVLQVPQTEDFEVTGDGSASAWNKAKWEPLHKRMPDHHSYEARFKVLYSKTGLYVLLDGTDQKLTATFQEDFANLWTEDVFEVFLWTDERHPIYFEYEISPLNRELPILVPNLGDRFYGWLPWHYEGNRKTRKATTTVGGPQKSGAEITGWKAEVFIPFELLIPLQNVPPKPGTRWRANFYRMDHDGGKTTGWDWARVGPSFHEYQKFGTLVFE